MNASADFASAFMTDPFLLTSFIIHPLLEWVRKGSNLHCSHRSFGFTGRLGDHSRHTRKRRQKGRRVEIRNVRLRFYSAFCLHPSAFILLPLIRTASYGNRTRSYASTGRRACRYTNKAFSNRGDRPGLNRQPRGSQPRAPPIELRPPTHTSAEEEGVEPSPPTMGGHV